MLKCHTNNLAKFEVARPGKTRRDKERGSWKPNVVRKMRAQEKSGNDMVRRGKTSRYAS